MSLLKNRRTEQTRKRGWKRETRMFFNCGDYFFLSFLLVILFPCSYSCISSMFFSKSASLGALCACRRDEVMHHRHSAHPISVRFALPAPATQSQAYGHTAVPEPLPEHLTLSSHAWRAVRAHTHAHTPTHKEANSYTKFHTLASLHDGRILDCP